MEIRRKLAGDRATNIFETLVKLDDDTYKEAMERALEKGMNAQLARKKEKDKAIEEELLNGKKVEKPPTDKRVMLMTNNWTDLRAMPSRVNGGANKNAEETPVEDYFEEPEVFKYNIRLN